MPSLVKTDAKEAPATRNRMEQISNAVEIDVRCGDERWSGSGVLISPTQVLTADHVAHCDSTPLIAVRRLGTNLVVQAMPELESDVHDVARLKFIYGAHIDDVTPPVIGPRPAVKSIVCFAAGQPSSTYQCGKVTDYSWDPRSELGHEATTIPGNSGAGVYDDQGRLVAIVTWHLDEPDVAERVFIGGRASVLDVADAVP